MASYIEKLLAEQLEMEKNTTEHDYYDRIAFDTLKEKSTKLKEIEKNKEKYPPFSELMQDIFYNFFKYKPTFFEDEKIDRRYLANKTLIQNAMKNENWKKMREMTKLDDANSAIATSFFAENIMKEIEKRDQKFMNEMQKLANRQQELIKKINDYKKANDQQKQQIEKEIQAKQQEMKKISKQASKSVSQISSSIAIKKATADMKNFFESMNAIAWGNELGELSFSNPKDKIALANYFIENKSFADLVRELGKLKNILAEARRQKVKHGTDEVYNVEMGNDLSRILPSELVKIKHRVLKRDFFKKLVNKELLQYRLRGKNKHEKGDIVVCVDVSGSMSRELPVPDKNVPVGVTRSVYAKALAIATLEIAVRENRAYKLIMFESRVRDIFEFDRNHKPTVDDIIKIASIGYGGGTDFQDPLSKAIAADKKRDVLFITDGECAVKDDFLAKFNKTKKASDTKVVALQVGNSSIDTLEKVSDIVYNYVEFHETSTNVFNSMMEERKVVV